MCRFGCSWHSRRASRWTYGELRSGTPNIGAGRVVYQDILRIDMVFQTNSFLKIPIAIDILERAKRRGRLHLLGLVSDGGIHSHIAHLIRVIGCSEGIRSSEDIRPFFFGRSRHETNKRY